MSKALPPRVPVTLRMPKTLRDRLQRLAKAEGLSLNNWIQTHLERQADK